MHIQTLIINLLTLIPIVLVFYKASAVKPFSSINPEFLSIGSTKSLRGICALCILFHHLTQQGYLEDAKCFMWFHTNGYLFVTIFFFLSGYGLLKQHMASENYRKKFLIKRLPGVLIPFLIALFLYLFIESTFGTVYSVRDILFHTFRYGNIDPFVPYAWYIIVILVFYVVFALLMLVFKNHYKLMVLGGLVWYACHVLLCLKLNYGGWWYVTSFVLVIGMFVAAFEKEILAIMQKSYFIIAPIVWLMTIALFVYKKLYGTTLAQTHPKLEVASTVAAAALFSICVVLLLMKFKVGNKITDFLGEISLEFYLFQAVWVKYLRSDLFRPLGKIYSYFEKPVIWALLIIFLTIITAYLLHLLIKTILKGYRKLIKA